MNGYIIFLGILTYCWVGANFMDKLLAKCLQGQKDAWDAFVQRYSGLIFTAVSRLLGNRAFGQQTHLAEDITQEVFLRLLKDDSHLLRAFDSDRASLATYLAIISRSTTIDFLRHRQLRTVPLDQAPDLPAPSQASPESVDLTQNLPKALLTARQKLVLHLLFDRQMDPKAAAKLLGISAQTVRSSKHKAIQKLRKHFKHSGDYNSS